MDHTSIDQKPKLKLGFNLLVLGGGIEEGDWPAIESLKELGYDGVEVPILTGSPSDYEKLGRRLDEIGLERTSISIVPDASADPVSADPEIRERGLRHLSWIQDCAEALGSQSVGGPFHSPLGHFTGRGATRDELSRGVEAHRTMAERAGRSGYIISLEPLNRFETYFLNTMAQARDYAEAVDHPAFRIMVDTFHMHIEEKAPAEAIRTIGDHIGILHVSENDRGIPGTGQIDFETAFREVKATGFDGWVVVEAFGNSVPEIVAATRVWRPLFQDTETLFRETIQFVRSRWAAA